ncbi:MAG: nitrate reductase molybdenum cofactor assembly chaperone [Cyanobacteria bacterium HKST-UBA03]|nr:nitrate reductase molybdenum cofactor assembly chaperone [Cyanobacteria bacterium HKST-UBA03]
MNTALNTASLPTRLSHLLDYPSHQTSELVQDTLIYLKDKHPDMVELFEPFAQTVAAMSISELQEAYTRVFDFSQETALEIGWHLYGEDYSRGAFLAKMREALSTHGVPEAGELPDHMTTMLLLLEKQDPESNEALVETVMQPALSKILDGLVKKESPYLALMTTIQQALKLYALGALESGGGRF